MILVIIAIGPGSFCVISAGFCGAEALENSSGRGNKRRGYRFEVRDPWGNCKHLNLHLTLDQFHRGPGGKHIVVCQWHWWSDG